MSKQTDEKLQDEPLKEENLKIDLNEVEAEAEAVEDEFDLLQEELMALKDKYARVHADFDNIKKRLEREKYTAVEYSNEKFAKDMIPVMDALQMALTSTATVTDPQEHLDKLNEGIELTLKQFTTS
ncbi:MAG: nucleotide exchange factor GrpE, partial [Sulfurimonas sp.]|nr:nucleotide exchange factor GrpE [Sulfurimonas sp.]